MSPGIDVDSYTVKWDLVLCLLLAWIFIFFCTIGGVKSSGKVMPVPDLRGVRGHIRAPSLPPIEGLSTKPFVFFNIISRRYMRDS